jgi:hypothetical protein
MHSSSTILPAGARAGGCSAALEGAAFKVGGVSGAFSGSSTKLCTVLVALKGCSAALEDAAFKVCDRVFRSFLVYIFGMVLCTVPLG